MIMGKVVGSLVSTIKHECYNNKRIMIVSPSDKDHNKIGSSIIAVDTVRAGIGDIVLVAAEGKTATEVLGFNEREPLRSVIVGIVDKVDLN